MTAPVWLIGCKGMLGVEVGLALDRAGIPWFGTDREVDITDLAAISAFAGSLSHAPSWIINCAGYTAVDRAEDDRETCRLINVQGAANIAGVAEASGAGMLHISTDYVFDGVGERRPYRPDDPANPTGVYGRSKLDGETAVLARCGRAVIIRTAWMYGEYGGNFVHTMLRLMNERERVSVVNDQWGSPTWARDLAGVLARIVAQGKGNVPYGIYHYTDEGAITWYDFAYEIYRQGRERGLVTRGCAVTPCTTPEYPTRAHRPAWSVLDTGKIRDALGITIPTWEESLGTFLDEKVQGGGT